MILLWDLPSGERRGVLFDPETNPAEGGTYKVADSETGRSTIYTLPPALRDAHPGGGHLPLQLHPGSTGP